ncbi:hypothetical protein R6Q57_021892 [Mikania cordata]
MDPEEWVQDIDGLFTTSTYKNRSLNNTDNRSKQLYGSYHGTQSYAQRSVPQHVEGWRDMHFKENSGWYNQLAEQHWNIIDELNKAKSTSGGDDTPVDEVEVLERSLGGQGASSFYHPGFETNQEKDQDQKEEEKEDEDEDESE